MNELRILAKELRLQPGAVAVLAAQEVESDLPQTVQIVVGCAVDSGLRAQDLLHPLLGQIRGKGGGDASLAQGGGLAATAQVLVMLELARTMITLPEA